MKWLIYKFYIKPRLDLYIRLQFEGWTPSINAQADMERLADLEKYYKGGL